VDRLCTPIVRKALSVVVPQFRLDARGGIHGLPHWTRVWFHGRQLAASLDLDPAVLAWFAFLHDSQRHSDGRDAQHGQRAADYAVKLRQQRLIAELAPSAFERLCEAMRLHSDGHTEGDLAIMACWDSDRLDLSRVGIQPRPARLCTSPARQSATIEAAVRMGDGLPRLPRAGHTKEQDQRGLV